MAEDVSKLYVGGFEMLYAGTFQPQRISLLLRDWQGPLAVSRIADPRIADDVIPSPETSIPWSCRREDLAQLDSLAGRSIHSSRLVRQGKAWMRECGVVASGVACV